MRALSAYLQSGEHRRMLPVYIGAMVARHGSETADLANQAVVDLVVELGRSSFADKVLIALSELSVEARPLVQLSMVDEISSLPALEASSDVCCAAAFRSLITSIESDVAEFKNSGASTWPPVIILVSDGRLDCECDACRSPFPEWIRGELESSIGPFIRIVVGVRGADSASLMQVSRLTGYKVANCSHSRHPNDLIFETSDADAPRAIVGLIQVLTFTDFIDDEEEPGREFPGPPDDLPGPPDAFSW